MFGSRKHAEKLGEVCKSYCHDCAEQVAWEVGKVTEWVTFFNHRAIPYKNEYFISCEACGDDFDLSKKDFQQIDATMGRQNSINDTPLKELLFQRIENHQLTSKSAIKRC